MWQATEKTSTGNSLTFGIQQNGTPLSHRQFLTLMQRSAPFRSFYNDLLAASDFDAFLWENMPMSTANINQPYECTLVKNTFLANRSPDEHTFRQHFDTNKQVVTFPNLGKDAQLIAPCPHNTPSCYTHIGAFVRKAGADQQDTLWRLTAQQMLDTISDKPRWLSTNGLGVFWLHVRIDSRPKYYQTDEYRSLSFT